MADYSFTPADVIASASGGFQIGTAGEAIAAGELLYRKAADNKLYKADADLEGATAPVGLAMCNAGAGQPVNYVTSGEITVTAATFASVGIVLALSDEAGKCCPVADVGTGDALVILGWTTATNKFRLQMVNTGVVL